ncbi:MAG: histidine triad nucleotide-binding protein [Bacteriovoracaceae bacterium]|nr:histidine triad nucleotide-binding protein [Bacteriovoracaceae bacterium]
MSDCIFCKIVEGKIPSTKIFENEKVIGFKDLRPQAVIHNLFIHKKHTKNINDLSQNDPSQLAEMFEAMRLYSEQENLSKDGFRIVTNLGPNAGQTVFHTHFHLLAGEPLGHFGS